MAQLVAAFGSSHSIMLMTRLEHWLTGYRARDQRLPFYDREGRKITYEEVVARAPADALDRITEDKITARFAETQQAMDRMASEVAAAKLDVMIIVGDDQYELFHNEHMPCMGIYYGDTIVNPVAPEVAADDWYKRGQNFRLETETERHYPCDSALALHLITGLVAREFDMAAVSGLNDRQFERHPYEGHAYSFVHKRYMDAANPIPIVPIFINTYNPPNQPTPARCLKLGAAIRELVASYPKNLRIGLMSSGGLSHFVVDEELDRGLMEACKKGDLAWLGGLDPRQLMAGSSEMRNWVVAASAARDLKVTWSAYIPGYRTVAMTGTGLGFAKWG